jgi:hypothetical protein
MLMKTTKVIYQGTSTPQDEPTHHVTERYLARNRLNARDRALAAGIIRGEVKIRSLTLGQTARLCRVSAPYVAAVRTPPPAPESLAEHFVRSTPAEWLEAARTVGIGAVWDRMISPLV